MSFSFLKRRSGAKMNSITARGWIRCVHGILLHGRGIRNADLDLKIKCSPRGRLLHTSCLRKVISASKGNINFRTPMENLRKICFSLVCQFQGGAGAAGQTERRHGLQEDAPEGAALLRRRPPVGPVEHQLPDGLADTVATPRRRHVPLHRPEGETP